MAEIVGTTAKNRGGVTDTPDLDLDWMKEAIGKHYEMQDSMIRAANKAKLTRNLLLDTLFEEGVLAVYNLGMEHMYKYLEDK